MIHVHELEVAQLEEQGLAAAYMDGIDETDNIRDGIDKSRVELPERRRDIRQGDGSACQIRKYGDTRRDDVNNGLEWFGDFLNLCDNRTDSICQERSEIDSDIGELHQL